MLNFQKQQNGFALIGMLIAIVIIAILFIYNDNTFFSRENDIKENKAIYEEAKKDLDEIEQIYNKKGEIINEK